MRPYLYIVLLIQSVTSCKREQIEICQHSVHSNHLNSDTRHPDLRNEDPSVYAGTCVSKSYASFTHVCLNNDHSKNLNFCCCVTSTTAYNNHNYDNYLINNNNNNNNYNIVTNNNNTTDNDLQSTGIHILCCSYHQSSNIFRCHDERHKVATLAFFKQSLNRFQVFKILTLSTFTAIIIVVVGVIVFRRLLRRKLTSCTVVGGGLCCRYKQDYENKFGKDFDHLPKLLNNTNNNNNNQNNTIDLNNNNNKHNTTAHKVEIQIIQNFNNERKNNKNRVYLTINHQQQLKSEQNVNSQQNINSQQTSPTTSPSLPNHHHHPPPPYHLLCPQNPLQDHSEHVEATAPPLYQLVTTTDT